MMPEINVSRGVDSHRVSVCPKRLSRSAPTTSPLSMQIVFFMILHGFYPKSVGFGGKSVSKLNDVTNIIWNVGSAVGSGE